MFSLNWPTTHLSGGSWRGPGSSKTCTTCGRPFIFQPSLCSGHTLALLTPSTTSSSALWDGSFAGCVFYYGSSSATVPQWVSHCWDSVFGAPWLRQGWFLWYVSCPTAWSGRSDASSQIPLRPAACATSIAAKLVESAKWPVHSGGHELTLCPSPSVTLLETICNYGEGKICHACEEQGSEPWKFSPFWAQDGFIWQQEGTQQEGTGTKIKSIGRVSFLLLSIGAVDIWAISSFIYSLPLFFI